MTGTLENSPLIELYRSLTPSEVRQLGKWTASPIHNQRDDVRDLHDYLSGRGRMHKTTALDKTRVWAKLFPGRPYDDARLRQTLHWALGTAQEFLAYKSWKREPMREQLDLVAELRRRRAGRVVERALKTAEKTQAKAPVRNEAFYRDEYQLEIERGEYRMFLKQRTLPDFQKIADTLDISYLIEKLKATWNMLFHQRQARKSFDIRFLDEVVGYVEKIDLTDHPLLAIHYYGYLGITGTGDTDDVLLRLRGVVENHGELLAPNDQRYIILMAINLCINRMNKGVATATREAFEWYRLGLRRDVIAEEDRITRATYLNFISICLKLKEFAVAESFLDGHTRQLDGSLRENTSFYGRALLDYERGRTEDAMPLLARVDFKHPTYNLLAKTLQLKIFYELRLYDLVDAQVENINTYVRRKELSDLHRDNFRNIARLVRRFVRLPPGDREKREELRRQVQTTSPLSEKAWLLGRLDEV